MNRLLAFFVILIGLGVVVGSVLAFDVEEPEKVFSYRLSAGDGFGQSIAAEGDMVAIGAPNTDEDSGAVYLFDCAQSPCKLASIVRPRDLDEDDQFGTSVALSEGMLVVGAPGDDDGSVDAGAVYLYECNADGCTRADKIRASDAASLAGFGSSLDYDGDLLVVGAAADSNGNGSRSGAAYVFGGCPEDCSVQAKLMPSDGERLDEFGFSVALDGEAVVVGAPRDSNISGLNAGAVYAFDDVTDCPEFEVRNEADTRCEEEYKLLASTQGVNRAFGAAVDVVGDVAVVGAPQERSGRQIDAGGVYVYTDVTACDAFNAARERATVCTEDTLIQVQTARLNMLYGSSVAYDGTRLIVGAPESATSVEGGSVYVYDDLMGCPDFDPDIRTTIPCRESSILRAPDRIAGDRFGIAVSLTDGWVFVGASAAEQTEYNPELPTATSTQILLITPTPTAGPPPVERNSGAAYAFKIVVEE